MFAKKAKKDFIKRAEVFVKVLKKGVPRSYTAELKRDRGEGKKLLRWLSR